MPPLLEKWNWKSKQATQPQKYISFLMKSLQFYIKGTIQRVPFYDFIIAKIINATSKENCKLSIN